MIGALCILLATVFMGVVLYIHHRFFAKQLDIFTPNAYSNDQVEQFRDIRYTLGKDDIAGWYRSIQLREIQLPTIISDELLLLISEKRNS